MVKMDVQVALFCVLLGFLEMIFMNVQAGVGPNSTLSLGLFNQSTGAISDKYPTPVTPAGYTFSIWGLIYLWNFAWIIYVITTLCRKNAGGYVYLNPPVTSVYFLIVYLLNNQINVLWLFVWDREQLSQASLALLCIALTLYVAMYISLTRVYQYLDQFKKIAESDLWAYRVLVHNGIAIYASWTTVATLVNLSVTLIYDFELPSDVVTYITLTILAVLLVTIFVFDVFVVDVYTRYVFLVYPTFIWSLAGIIVANQYDTSSAAFIYATILVTLAGIFFIVKTVFMIIREPVFLIVKKAAVQASIYNAPYYTRVYQDTVTNHYA